MFFATYIWECKKFVSNAPTKVEIRPTERESRHSSMPSQKDRNDPLPSSRSPTNPNSPNFRKKHHSENQDESKKKRGSKILKFDENFFLCLVVSISIHFLPQRLRSSSYLNVDGFVPSKVDELVVLKCFEPPTTVSLVFSSLPSYG
ncbi:hypothetical protein RclHR1_00610020 [Rhizophagus clarus]|uniref:Uncharacterized protein n=1 Tax=Rhizophagus clarus TaxID=94130 RepID=A0A2Z6RQ85_9GLOM|nr:hypothetical protein RclHR1_00610020 [Rhizophagus clarus]